MTEAPPEPVRSEDVGVFDREKELVWMPLDQAFDQLVSAVPELAAVRERAGRLARSPQAFSVERNVGRDRIVVPGQLHSEAMGDADKLVGPGSDDRDALVRSSLARQVVSEYVTAILAGPDAALSHQALWDPTRPRPTLRWSGSFVEFG